MSNESKLDDARAQTLEDFLKEQQSAGVAVFALGQDVKAKVDAIPTGAIALDVALGVGGIPRGRIVELYGPESGGKTSTSLAIAAEAQAMGLNVGFVDAEHALDPDHARTYGVDLDRLAFFQPMSGEEGLEMTNNMALSGAFGLIIIDSVAALTPKAEIEGSMEDLQVGAMARMMGKGLRKIASSANQSKTAIIFINQIREKIGVQHGNPETTPGGRALKFGASVRLEVRSSAGDRIYDGPKTTTAPVGQTVRVKVVKNKVAPPMKRAEFNILYASGVDKASGILEAGKDVGTLTMAGASITEVASGERLAVGKPKFVELLAEQPEVAERLTKQIYAVLNGAPVATPDQDGEETADAAA